MVSRAVQFRFTLVLTKAMKERLSLTPGTPRFTARRVEDPEDKVNPQDHEIYRSGVVEKSVFSIWVDLLLCRSIQLLVLSYAEMFVYMYLSQLMSTFTNYLKVHHLPDGFFNP